MLRTQVVRAVETLTLRGTVFSSPEEVAVFSIGRAWECVLGSGRVEAPVGLVREVLDQAVVSRLLGRVGRGDGVRYASPDFLVEVKGANLTWGP